MPTIKKSELVAMYRDAIAKGKLVDTTGADPAKLTVAQLKESLGSSSGESSPVKRVGRKKAAPQEPAPQVVKIKRKREPTEATRAVKPNILAQAAANAVGAPIPKSIGYTDATGAPIAMPVGMGRTAEGKMYKVPVKEPKPKGKPGRKRKEVTKASQKKAEAAERRAARAAAKSAKEAAKAERKAARAAKGESRPVKYGKFADFQKNAAEQLSDILNMVVPEGGKIKDYQRAARITNKILKCAYKNVPRQEQLGRMQGPKKARKGSSWVEHVKKVAAERGIKYSEALKVAGASYNK